MATYQLKVSIEGTDPSVWRKIIVPDHITFHQLHLVIQEIFQWKDYHLYKFELPDVESIITRLYDDPCLDEDVDIDARETLIDPYMSNGLRFRYIYDFGDWWEHIIDVEGIDLLDESRVPYLASYQGESMIEDAGGVGGYYETMRILSDPSDPEYHTTKAWVEWQGPDKLSLGINEIMDEVMYFPKIAYTSVKKNVTSQAGTVGPKVELDEVVNAIKHTSDTLVFYINLDTGAVQGLFLKEFDGAKELYWDSRAKYNDSNPLMLPTSKDFDDYKVMCHFADAYEGIVGEKLHKAVEGRGAFKRFKNEIKNLDISDEWDAYRDEAYRQFARDFLEAHDVRWM